MKSCPGISRHSLIFFFFISFLTIGHASFFPCQVSGNSILAGEKAEEIKEVEEISPAAEAGAPGFFEYLGRAHVILIHIPIGWLIMVVLIDLGAFVLRLEGWEKWGLYALIGTVISFVPAITTGLLNASHLPENSPDLHLAAWHRNLMMIMAVLCIIALLLRLKQRNRLEGFAQWTYLGLILIAAGTMTIAGHIGGMMVFGENYLPF